MDAHLKNSLNNLSFKFQQASQQCAAFPAVSTAFSELHFMIGNMLSSFDSNEKVAIALGKGPRITSFRELVAKNEECKKLGIPTIFNPDFNIQELEEKVAQPNYSSEWEKYEGAEKLQVLFEDYFPYSNEWALNHNRFNVYRHRSYYEKDDPRSQKFLHFNEYSHSNVEIVTLNLHAENPGFWAMSCEIKLSTNGWRNTYSYSSINVKNEFEDAEHPGDLNGFDPAEIKRALVKQLFSSEEKRKYYEQLYSKDYWNTEQQWTDAFKDLEENHPAIRRLKNYWKDLNLASKEVVIKKYLYVPRSMEISEYFEILDESGNPIGYRLNLPGFHLQLTSEGQEMSARPKAQVFNYEGWQKDKNGKSWEVTPFAWHWLFQQYKHSRIIHAKMRVQQIWAALETFKADAPCEDIEEPGIIDNWDDKYY